MCHFAFLCFCLRQNFLFCLRLRLSVSRQKVTNRHFRPGNFTISVFRHWDGCFINISEHFIFISPSRSWQDTGIKMAYSQGMGNPLSCYIYSFTNYRWTYIELWFCLCVSSVKSSTALCLRLFLWRWTGTSFADAGYIIQTLLAFFLGVTMSGKEITFPLQGKGITYSLQEEGVRRAKISQLLLAMILHRCLIYRQMAWTQSPVCETGNCDKIIVGGRKGLTNCCVAFLST